MEGSFRLKAYGQWNAAGLVLGLLLFITYINDLDDNAVCL